MLLKLGSKGNEVSLLRNKLNINNGDIFDTECENAVKQFQKSHGLKVDGIVGDKTWSLLNDNIIYDPLSVHITKMPNRDLKYIAIHFTAGSNSKPGKARGVKKVFEQRAASADFCIDDRDIVQFNPDIRNYYCWAVGDKLKQSIGGGKLHNVATNRNTISIEICSTCNPSTIQAVSYANHKGWSFTEASLENTRKLVRILMKRYNIDKNHVIRHYDVTGKQCPGLIGWNDEPVINIFNEKTGQNSTSEAWINFKNSL